MLIVDANVVIASLLSKGTVFLILKQLSETGVRLVSPSFLKEEVEEHFNEIMRETGFDEPTYDYNCIEGSAPTP
ncbi:MAG: PIN domain-containing protein [Thermoproteota archaeon]